MLYFGIGFLPVHATQKKKDEQSVQQNLDMACFHNDLSNGPEIRDKRIAWLLSILYDLDCLLHHSYMPKIRTQSISKTFPDGTQALHSVNLEIHDGELLALVGPSGCGKTTLLRIFAGLDTATEGEIFFDESEISKLPPDQRDLGMVFQNYALFPHLTVFKNILLSLEKSNLSKIDKEEQVQKVAHSLGLADLLMRKPSEISGGQRQRVALARLLARNPSIHLLDEPLSNLDANLRLEMRQELAELHQKHQKTTLFVTHDQVEAMTLGQRICLLNQGSVEQMGTPQELYDSPKNLFVAEFFGMPSINLIHGSIESKSNEEQAIFNSRDANLSLPLPPEIQPSTQKVILGIRSESIFLIEHSPKNLFLIHRIEYLGDSQVSYLDADELEITCKQPSFDINPADKVGIKVNWNHVHWFDPANGQRIQLIES